MTVTEPVTEPATWTATGRIAPEFTCWICGKEVTNEEERTYFVSDRHREPVRGHFITQH